MYYVISFIVGVVIGAVASWLITRNNPKFTAQAESIAQKVEDKI